MPVDFAAVELIPQLSRVGPRPPERLVQQILRGGDAIVNPLLDLALKIEALHGDEPECYGPIHALRLLGELRPIAMIVPVIAKFPIELEYEDETIPQLWGREAPQIIGRIGAPAIEPLWAIADDSSYTIQGRGAALSSLAYVADYEPETKASILAGLRERLAKDLGADENAIVISALANLSDADSYPQVLALYREKKVNPRIIAAGAARQMLLTYEEKRLACVKHPLWERYDQHGPISQNPS